MSDFMAKNAPNSISQTLLGELTVITLALAVFKSLLLTGGRKGGEGIADRRAMNERKANGLSKTRPHEVASRPHASLKTRVIALPRSETNHLRFSHLPACDRQRQTMQSISHKGNKRLTSGITPNFNSLYYIITTYKNSKFFY